MKKCIKCNNNKKYNHQYCRYCLSVTVPPFHEDAFKKEYIISWRIQELLDDTEKTTLELEKRFDGLPYRCDISYTNMRGNIIIIEIDEHAHKNYLTNDGLRDINILKGIPNSLIIRINVDGYKSSGMKYPPIWKKSSLYVDESFSKIINVDTNYTELERRMSIIHCVLYQAIEKNLTGEIVKLFYDN